MRKLYFLLALAAAYAYPASSQDQVSFITKLDSLQYSASMPDDVLSTKSLGIIQIPNIKKRQTMRGDWKALASTAQPGFKKAGIDVVSYYYADDIYSGKESFDAFMGNFKDREIENIVAITQDNGIYRIVLTKIHDENTLVKAGQQAWKTENADLSAALNNLYRAAANASQDKQNLLIMETPEYGEMPKTIKGKRGEYYDVNFSSEKLAVPIFADTSKISQIMAQYPYKYGYVDPSSEEKKIRADGHQYILYYIHTTGKAVKEMLEYPVTDTETDYVSEATKDGMPRVNSYHVNTPVYKFYIKHIYTGNVFLGKKWDAAPTWEEALNNYLDNLRNELVRK